jgi:hypothetical protein
MSRTWKVLPVLLLVSGCGTFDLAGSKAHKGVPPEAKGTWTVPACEVVADGSKAPAPTDQTYYLAQTETGPVLYELDPKGNGTAITNRWTDEQGDHFMTYLRGSFAWEYVIPASGGRGARMTYLPTRYKVETVDGALKLVSGTPTHRCAMVPK